MASDISLALPSRLPDEPMLRITPVVSAVDKQSVCAAFGGDDRVLTLITQHAFRRVATYIKQHGIGPYTSADYAADRKRLIEFIANAPCPCDARAERANGGLRNSPDSRPAGDAAALHDAGAAPRGQPAPADLQSRAADVGQSAEGRVRHGKQARVGKIRDAAKRARESSERGE